MPSQAFLMSGMGASFCPAGPCPVTDGPHCAPDSERSFMVADATTGDRSAQVRLVLWRCRFCRALLAGLGRADESPVQSGYGTGVDVQEFTWLEEAVPLLAARPGNSEQEKRTWRDDGGGTEP